VILIVTHDLTNGKNYASLFEAIKLQGDWWHYMASTWIISTMYSPEQVYNNLCGHILKSDRLFVGTLTRGYEGWLAQDAWDWLKARGLHPK
jgi:hypothetical protein